MARVLIAVPTFENITPDTFKALWDMDKGEHEVLFEFVRGHDCATARNKIVDKAFELCADYVLMVDNDVTPPKDALLNLLSHDVDVVLGYYAHRNADNVYTGRVCVCKYLKDDGTPWFNYPLESEWTADELREKREAGEYLIQIHGGGMGCALINMSVFDRLDYPWYDWVNYHDKKIGMLSEDLYFCEKCKADFTPIYTDTRVACGHLMRRIQQV